MKTIATLRKLLNVLPALREAPKVHSEHQRIHDINESTCLIKILAGLSNGFANQIQRQDI